MALFDLYIAADWSANDTPKSGSDSIWVAVGSRSLGTIRVTNHRTRRAAETSLLEELLAAGQRRERVLAGFDFPFGYPAGFASLVGLGGDPWSAVWAYLADVILDDDLNASNRFEVASALNKRLGPDAPFWGRPARRELPNLPSRKTVVYRGERKAGGLHEWRGVERVLKAHGARPHSAWKLFYPGSVASQSLLGIPVLQRLRNHPAIREISCVWPFETAVPDLPEGIAAIVFAEMWPSIVPFAEELGSCRDEQQVRASVNAWSELDRRGQLGGWLALPADACVRREEGWILGVPAGLMPRPELTAAARVSAAGRARAASS